VVRIEGTSSSFFQNKTGLKHGYPLSPILFNLVLHKVIQSIKMVPSGIKIGKEQFNVLAYTDDIVLTRKKMILEKKNFCTNGKHCQKVQTTDNQEKTKYMIVERKNSLKENKIGHLKIKNYKFERVEF